MVREVEEATFELKTESDLSNEHVYENKAVRWMVSMNSTLNYFECEIISKGESECGIWIGIGPWPGNTLSHENIVCCQVGNGHVQACGKQAVKLNLLICSEGDKIGCGIEFDSEHHSKYVDVFFTKNGVQVGNLIKCKKPRIKICPMVGMGEKGERIRLLRHYYRPSLLSVSKANLS